MKKSILFVVVLIAMAGMACAEDCTSYFSNANSKRDKAVSSSSTLVLSSGRLYTATRNVYNSIDDLGRNENLTSIADDFSNLINKRDNANDDLSNLYNRIDDYDNAVSDAGSGLPSVCRNFYNAYDDDVTKVKDWEKTVKKDWSKFTSYYDPIASLNGDLAGHLADSNTRSKADDLESHTSDFTDTVGNGIDWDINGSVIANTTLINESSCFDMVNKNIDITTKACNVKWQDYVTKIMKNCTQPSVTSTTLTQVCPKSTCDDQVNAERARTADCENRVSLILQSQNNMTQITLPPNTNSAMQIASLKTANQNLTLANQALAKQLDDAKNSSPNCLMYQALAVIEFFIMLFAWIIGM
jgi:hypothetical protein